MNACFPAFSGGAALTNALIRCTRNDSAAHPIFDLVRDDRGLWVLELDFDLSKIWESQIESISRHIERHRVSLASLAEGSSDFTLHMAVETSEALPLRIPVRLSRLAAECGFEIEILMETQQVEQCGVGNSAALRASP